MFHQHPLILQESTSWPFHIFDLTLKFLYLLMHQAMMELIINFAPRDTQNIPLGVEATPLKLCPILGFDFRSFLLTSNPYTKEKYAQL